MYDTQISSEYGSYTTVKFRANMAHIWQSNSPRRGWGALRRAPLPCKGVFLLHPTLLHPSPSTLHSTSYTMHPAPKGTPLYPCRIVYRRAYGSATSGSFMKFLCSLLCGVSLIETVVLRPLPPHGGVRGFHWKIRA